MNRDEAIQKAMKLLRLATSDNPHEAALAAQRAQEILDRFEITQAMLEDPLGNQESEEEIVNFAEKRAPLDEFGAQVETWKSYLSTVVAEANACCIFTTKRLDRLWMGPRSFFHIVGRPSDVEKVRYLYGYLVHETDRLCQRQGKGCGRTWRNQFRLGVVDTIEQRFAKGHQDLMVQMRKEVQGQSQNNPLALVRLEKAIARVEKKLVDTQAWMAEHLRLRSAQGHQIRLDPSARTQGRIAGSEINLTQARGAITSAKLPG